MVFPLVFTKAFASASRVNEVFDTKPSVTLKTTDIIETVPGAPAVEFRGVSFGYGEGGDALSDISFTAEKGKTIGIIGGTGSGKSTVINLYLVFTMYQRVRCWWTVLT